MEIGICEGCLKPSMTLKVQVCFEVKRTLCAECRKGVIEVEKQMQNPQMITPQIQSRAEQARLRYLQQNKAVTRSG